VDISYRGTWQPRFDAYAATVDAPASDLLAALEGITPGAEWREMERAPHGYGVGWRLADVDGPVGVVFAGGMHQRPHVSVQGEASPAAAALLRECWPGHKVARADVVALDTDEPGGYDRLQAMCVDVAREMRVKLGTAGDHLVTKEGRTVYLGASKSSVRLRCYDKAAQLRAELRTPSKLAAVPDHLARLELQVRPQSAAKVAASYAQPVELLGSARWMRALMARVDGSELAPFTVRSVWRESDGDAAYWSMLSQYGRTLYRLLDEAGSPDLVGRNIFADLAVLERKS
jgi:Replication initiation factor